MSTTFRSTNARSSQGWRRLLATAACLAAIAVSAHAGTSLISKGSPVRILVPADDTLASSWWDTSLDDSSWTEGVNGVGYQTGLGGYESQILADSISEWSSAGQQGENYWSYGYYDKTGDADATYQAGDFRIFPRSAGGFGPNNFWDGTWNWFQGDPPWTSIGQTFIHPNGINNAVEHWAIRRWQSTYAGPITLVFKFAKGNTACCGVTGKIFQNGAEIFSRAIYGTDIAGYTVYVNTTVAVGDLLDFAQTPINPDGDTGDGSDASEMSARVYAGTLVEPVATTDSVNDWSATGTQGALGWFYGFYNKTADADGVYDPATDFNTSDLGWSYNGSAWVMVPGNPPWTSIGQSEWHPAGDNPVHWPIRRWVSTVSGDLNTRVQFAKSNTGGGNGTTLRVLHNGVEKFSRTVAGTDGTGFNVIVELPGVAVGDFIEFALDPLGQDGGSQDGSDGSKLRASIFQGTPFQPGLQGEIATDVQTQMKGVNSSVYVRIPFQVADPSAIQTLKLKLKWNDGYVAYLNGNAIDKKNAPTVISGATVADSIADWSMTGEQGFNGWYYGYYDRSTDADGVFQVEDLSYFPRDLAGYSATDFWTGSGYDWFNGNPPWTELFQENFHPNSPNAGAVDPSNPGTHEQWLVRRWTAQSDGNFKVRVKFAKTNPNCGDGVIGYVFHNGTQLYSQSIAGNDVVGRDDVVDVPDVLFGEQIDIVMAPGPSDGCDGSKFSAVIFDGAPIVPWNAAALAARTPDETIAPTILDIPVSLLNAGDNLLAIQGINASANDGNFLIAAELVANNLPTAVADSLIATKDQALELPFGAVLANDTDPDGDALQLVGVTPGGVTPAGGTVALLGDRLVYTPAAGFSGTDSFTYTIADGSGVPVEGAVQVNVLNLQQTYASFDSSLPAGDSAFGTAGLNPTGGINDSGILRITDAVNGQSGTFVTAPVLGGQPVTEFSLQAMVRIAGATCCTAGRNELRPADGMSFNFASDIPLDAAWSAGALEEGAGTGLRVTFDTWDSGDPDSAPAIELVYNGAVKAVAPLDGWRDNNIPDAGMIPLDPQNGAPLTLYTDARDQTFVRVTSGPNAGQIYQCHQGDGTPDIATLPDGKLAGPTIYVGLAGDATTSLVPPPPGPGYIALIQRGTYAFAIKASNALAAGYAGVVVFNTAANGNDYIVPGMGAPAALIPTVMVGHSRGLAIAGVADATALVEGAAGADISIERVTPPVAPWGAFAWTLRSDGSCDIWWKGVKIIDNVQTGYVPTAGRFGIGGRTGGANEAHWVDDLLISYYSLPGPAQIVKSPASVTVAVDRAAQFEVFAVGTAPLSYEWSLNGVPVPGVTGPVLVLNGVTLADDQSVVSVVVSNPDGSVTSEDAILTVIFDDVPPSLVSVNGSAALNQFFLRFNEPLYSDSANDSVNYSIDGLNINAVALQPDGQTVLLTTDPQVPGTSYTITYNDINDPYFNAVSGTAIGQSFVLTPGLVRFDYFNGLSTADNSLDNTLLLDPRFPNNPTATYYITAFNSRQVFPTDATEGYGARMTGAFMPPVDGNYVFWLLSDDSSRLWLNPTGIDPAGKVQIADEAACCGPWSKVFSTPQPLTAGQAYYIEAVYKEGGGGDYLHVGATLEGQPAPSDATRDSIQGSQVAGLYNPVGAELNVTQQPQSQTFLFNPLGSQTFVSEDFNSTDGGFTVSTPLPYDGPWVYNAGTGSWNQDGQAADNSRTNTSMLNSPAYAVTVSGNIELSFVHRYSFEGGFWDGGQVRVSINGGAYTAVPAVAFTQNGYNGTVLANSASDLKGQAAFVENSTGYETGPITSTASLGFLNAGDTVSVQFMASADTNTRGQFVPNWEVTSIALKEGGLPPLTTFTAAATGSVGGQATTVYYQWQKDTGAGFANIPGATASSYTFAPLMADNGSKFRVQVLIPGSTQFSDEATLTTVQLNTAPSFAKGPDQSAQCATGPQSIAGWATGIKPHSIPQVTGAFANTFDSGPPAPGPAPWTTDFSAGVPDGTVPSGTTAPYVGADGSLHITDQVNGQANYWNIPSLGSQTVNTFQASWLTKITGVGGADGFSFNVGENIGLPGTPEEGTPTGLSVSVDTYNNGAFDAGVEIKYNGARLGFLPVGPGIDTQGAPAELALDAFVPTSVDVDASGLVTFTYATYTVTGQIPDYTGLTINQYVFAARTGGANENCHIDDVSISLPPLVGAPAPAGSKLYGNAYIANGSLHLTDAVNGQAGSIVIDDLLGGGRLGSFEMTFTAQVGGGTPTLADGFSVSVANDLPSGTWGEDGAGTGLTVSFDSYDNVDGIPGNGGDEAPAIDVLWNGAVIAHTLVPSLDTAGQFAPVSIKLDADGTLDVVAAGTPVYTDLPTGSVPILGARFGLAGRTGGLNQNTWIDDLSIVAYPFDASTAEAGQALEFIVSNDNAALFSVQPAITPNGTLTYSPAISGEGVANVSVVLKDDGGTAYGGQDTAAAQTFTITIGCAGVAWTSTQIGGGPLGSITPNPEPGSYTVEGGGSDIWDMSDEFTFHYLPVTGDFDVRVRVESVEVTARWPKAGIMARETLAGDSRMAFSKVTPAGPITPAANCGQTEGAADVSFMYRTWIPGAGGNGGQHEDRLVADPGYPTYKWVRLQRVGSVMKGYASADGVIWQAPVVQDTANWVSPIGGVLTPFAQNALLGLAVSRHGCTEESAPGDTATTEFRELATQPPVILVQPASIVSAAGTRATFSVTTDGSYTSVQWRKNGVDIPGARSTVYTTPVLAAENDAEVFSVVLVNQFTGDSVTSDEAMLEVTGEFPGDVLTHRWNFDTDANDSIGGAHGTLINGAALAGNAVTMSGAQQYVDLPNGLFDTYNSITIEAWATDNNGGAWARLWDFGNTTLGEDPDQNGATGYDGANYMFFTWPIGDLTGVRAAYKQTTTGEQIVGDLRPRPSVGVKHHIVWVQDAAAQSARIYIDGELKGQNFFSFKPSECGPYLNNWLGRSMYKGDSYFNGSIDEFRVFNAAVPAEYVAASTALGPDAVLTPGAVTIVQQPANTSVNPGAPATFQVVLNGTLPYTAQWFRNGVVIPGATSPIYTFTATPADDGASYHAEVGNPFGTATTDAAVLSVFDVTPPTLVSAGSTGNPTEFDLVFSEAVDQGTAEDTANYSMTAGVTLDSAVLQPDGKTVRFTCSRIDGLGRKVLTVNGVTDTATPPNAIASNSEIPVLYAAGSITRRLYSEIGAGVAISDLRNAAKFPDAPDLVDTRIELEAPWDFADNYGQQMLGWITPPISGDYTFYISSDDNAELWLSTDENPANIARIAIEPVWAGRRLWTGNGGDDTEANANRGGTSPNVSAPIPLVAGQRYYIEALNKEGGGGDNLAVAWRKPGDFVPAQGSAPIPGAFLSPNFPATITASPADTTVEQTKPVSFSVDFIGIASVKWYRDGSEIPGATGRTYTIPNAIYPDDDQATFYAVVENELGSATSATATLTVTADATPPSVVSVLAGPVNRVIVTFSEPVDAGTGGDSANYLIDGGLLGVISTLVNGNNVVLVTDAQNPGQIYNLVVENVTDLAGNGVAANENPFTGLASAQGVLRQFYYNLVGGNVITTLTENVKYPGSPDAYDILATTLSPQSSPDIGNYGVRMRTYLIPSETGFYRFDHYSDDAGITYLSTDADPANKQILVNETSCCAHRTSPQVYLTAGMVYYLEGIFQEGGGGDYLEIRWFTPSNPGAYTDIPAENLFLAFDPTQAAITQHPQDATTFENRSVAFAVTLSNPQVAPLSYQWQRAEAADPATFVDIPGATAHTYTTPLLTTAADDGALYRVVVGLGGIPALTSDAATVTVLTDADPPTLVSATGSESFTQVTVRFSEAVEASTGSDSANYSIDGGLGFIGATLSADGMSVVLTTDFLQAQGTLYTVTVNSVMDLAGNPIADGSTASFTAYVFTPGLLRFDYFAGLSTSDNALDTTLLADPRYPNNPTATYYMSSFNSRNIFPNDAVEGYGARVSGIFVPPVDGNYVFYLWSDDSSRLFLNPTGIDPAGKVLIAEEIACCNAWNTATEIKSAPQPLMGGQHYYIEGIYKEGGGGDYIYVAARLEGEPSPANATLDSIQSSQLGVYADPTGAMVTITEQPADQLFIVNPAGSGSATALLSQDFNADNGGFTVSGSEATGPWVYDAAGTWSGSGHTDCGTAQDSALTSPALTVTKAGYVKISFSHAYNFESDSIRWDGGQVRVSVNGGPFTTVQNGSFTARGYDGVIASGASINGQEAFNGNSGGWVTSEADLGFHGVGDTLAIQFFAAWDECYTPTFPAPSWTIDSVTVTEGDLPSTVTFSVAAIAERNGAAWPNIVYQWQKNTGSGFVDIAGAVSTSYTFPPTLADNGTLFRVNCIIPGVVETSREALLSVGLVNTPPSFTLVPPPASDSGAGPQTVPGVAQDILPCTTVGASIKARMGLNFAANDNGAALGLASTETAGVVPQGNWNNLNDANGSASSLVADYTGRAKTTAASVTWSCPNTWASTGRGEENNAFPAGADRKMMTGYLDSDNAAAVVTVTVADLGPDFTTGGYDVIVYALGGTSASRWGAYSIGTATQILNSAASPAGFIMDPGVDANDTGNYTVFKDLTGSSFTLIANAVTPVGNGTRAPVNGIQIIAKAAIPPAARANVLSPSDAVVLVNGVNDDDTSAGAPPAAESVAQATDGVTQKYLNFLDLGSGFAVTPNYGLSVVTGIRLYTANDAEERDPASYVLEGSTAGSAGPWTLIAEGPLALPSGRNPGGSIPVDPAVHFNQLVSFANSTAYSSYRVTFPTLKNAAAANSMQIAEVELLGTEFAQKDCGPESSQSVQFIVSSDKPELFSVQPAISPNGTLTYTAAGCGVAQVSVVAMDDGGTAFGNDTSDPQTFTLTVNCGVNHPPVVRDLFAQTGEGKTATIALAKLLAGASDPDAGQTLSVSDAGPVSANGGAVVLGADSVSYTPAEGFSGLDTFPFTVSDGNGGTATALVRFTVVSADGLTPNIFKVTVVGGDYVIGFGGLPGTTYAVQRAGSVTGPWTTLTTVSIGQSGVAEYRDSDPNRPNPTFYRAIPQP